MQNPISIVLAATLLVACAQPDARPDVARRDEPVSCLKETGSRIQRKPGECNNNPGRVIEREEMERTGAFTTFDAIRRTVPQAN